MAAPPKVIPICLFFSPCFFSNSEFVGFFLDGRQRFFHLGDSLGASFSGREKEVVGQRNSRRYIIGSENLDGEESYFVLSDVLPLRMFPEEDETQPEGATGEDSNTQDLVLEELGEVPRRQSRSRPPVREEVLPRRTRTARNIDLDFAEGAVDGD